MCTITLYKSNTRKQMKNTTHTRTGLEWADLWDYAEYFINLDITWN